MGKFERIFVKKLYFIYYYTILIQIFNDENNFLSLFDDVALGVAVFHIIRTISESNRYELLM